MTSARSDGVSAHALRFRRLHLLAAVLAVSVVALAAFHTKGLHTARAAPDPLSPETTYVTPFGQHRDIALPGIVIAANTETTIHAQHSPTSVHLTLTRGEIVADASKTPSMPFVIGVDDLQIQSSSPNTVACTDPVKTCSGVILSGDTHEHVDGRRDQALDGAS